MKARNVMVFAAVVVFAYGASCTGFREDEIDCEQAVVHLTDCCPGFVASKINCEYDEHRDCSDSLVSTQYPALDTDESDCLRGKTCEELVADGLCDLAQTVDPAVVAVDGGATANRDEIGKACK